MLTKRQDEFRLQSCDEFQTQISNLVPAAEGYFQVLKTGVNPQVGSPEEQIIKLLEEAIKKLRTAFDVANQENFVKGNNVIAFASSASDLHYDFVVEMAAKQLKVDGTLEYKELIDTLRKIHSFGFTYVRSLHCTTS
ncbi:hypothetical protein BGX23_012121 [Mortierella sp. AD031]|nr:hypothetical protein BGX23_012121 [Mortierella sp. AD031]